MAVTLCYVKMITF